MFDKNKNRTLITQIRRIFADQISFYQFNPRHLRSILSKKSKSVLLLQKKYFMNFLTRLVTSSLAIIIVTYLLPGVSVESPVTAIIVAGVLALLNMVIKPLLVLLTLPITVVTLGLFLLVINAFIILLAANIVPGFHVNGFWWALLFSIILSIVTGIFNSLAKPTGTNNE